MSTNDRVGGEDHGRTDAHRPGDIADEPHGPDDHAHGSEALGPVDVQAWGALAVGIGLGLIVAICVALSTGAL
jgi:hypothetical protein